MAANNGLTTGTFDGSALLLSVTAQALDATSVAGLRRGKGRKGRKGKSHGVEWSGFRWPASSVGSDVAQRCALCSTSQSATPRAT